MRAFRLFKANGLRSPTFFRQRLRQQHANEFAEVHSLPDCRLFHPVFQLPWHANGHLHVRWPAHVDSLARVSTHPSTSPVRIWARER